MKALSLWQPHASLMQTGAKKIETRSWEIDYRGPLLICSTKSGPSKREMKDMLKDRFFQIGLADLVDKKLKEQLLEAHFNLSKVPTGKTFSSEFDFHPVKIEHLPLGKALCVVDLVDIQPWGTFDITEHDLVEDLYGDIGPGRYMWITENRRPIEPIPITGRQGLFNVPEELQSQFKFIEL